MEPLIVFKLITKNEFIPNKEYDIIDGRKYHKVKCIKSIDNAWYFYTELDDVKTLLYQDVKMRSENQIFKLLDIDKKFLKFVEARY